MLPCWMFRKQHLSQAFVDLVLHHVVDLRVVYPAVCPLNAGNDLHAGVELLCRSMWHELQENPAHGYDVIFLQGSTRSCPSFHVGPVGRVSEHLRNRLEKIWMDLVIWLHDQHLSDVSLRAIPFLELKVVRLPEAFASIPRSSCTFVPFYALPEGEAFVKCPVDFIRACPLARCCQSFPYCFSEVFLCLWAVHLGAAP